MLSFLAKIKLNWTVSKLLILHLKDLQHLQHGEKIREIIKWAKQALHSDIINLQLANQKIFEYVFNALESHWLQ